MLWRASRSSRWIASAAVALPPGLLDLGRFALVSSGLGLALLLVLWLATRTPATRVDERARARVVFLALFGPLLATSGGDSFPLWRFYVPLAPVLLTAADDGLRAALDPRPWPERTKRLAHVRIP